MPVRLDSRQSFGNTLVNGGVIELVLAIVRKKVFERLLEKVFVLGVAESPPHQHGRTVADVGSHNFSGQLGALEVPQRGVHGMDQVEAGIDQGAVQVKYEELHDPGIESATETRHGRRIARVPSRCSSSRGTVGISCLCCRSSKLKA